MLICYIPVEGHIRKVDRTLQLFSITLMTIFRIRCTTSKTITMSVDILFLELIDYKYMQKQAGIYSHTIFLKKLDFYFQLTWGLWPWPWCRGWWSCFGFDPNSNEKGPSLIFAWLPSSCWFLCVIHTLFISEVTFFLFFFVWKILEKWFAKCNICTGHYWHIVY